MMKTLGIGALSGKESGGSLVFLMSVVMALAATSAAMLGAASSRGRAQISDRDARVAFTAADSGIDQAVALGNANSFATLAQNASTNLATMYVGGAAVNVRVNRLADTVNGATTTRTLRVESTASYGREARSVVAFLRQIETSTSLVANIPVVQSAMMLGDPFSQVTFNGVSFTIKGSDKNIDGTPGPNPTVFGMGIGPQSNGTPGNPTQVTAQLSNNQKPLITGTAPTPASLIASVGPVNPVNINGIIQALAPYATMSFNNYQGTYTGSLGTYPGTPKLIYSNGDLKVSGSTGGYGIMVIDGNLTINGNWDFTGLIFCGGKLTFSGGGNTKKLTGAAFIDGDTQDLAVSGNINVQYSSQAITNVTNFLGTLNPPATTTPYSFVSSAETRRLN